MLAGFQRTAIVDTSIDRKHKGSSPARNTRGLVSYHARRVLFCCERHKHFDLMHRTIASTSPYSQVREKSGAE